MTVDLATASLPSDGRDLTLVPLYDGVPGEEAMWAALLDGRAPQLSLYDTGTDGAGRFFDIGQPAIEAPQALQMAAGAVVIRLIEGIAHHIAGRLDLSPSRGTEPSKNRIRPTVPAVASLASRKLANRLHRKMQDRADPEQWSVAYGVRDADAAWPSGTFSGTTPLDPAAYRLLADDGQRYYADPFLFADNGRVFLFVEELPYATDRGIISVTELPGDGSPPATPRPVLDTGLHLSYPHVFARDGEIWMLPEQHKSGAVILYRAVTFPDVWQQAAILIGEPLHDATLFEHGGRLWIAATDEGPLFELGEGAAAFRWGSSWDALVLYSAPALLGPWTRHVGNPLLIDAAVARPAGPVLVDECGALLRPVQDCATGYGRAVSLARIDHLDGSTFRQSILGRLQFDGGGLSGPHALSRLTANGRGYEAVDVFGRRARLQQAFAAR